MIGMTNPLLLIALTAAFVTFIAANDFQAIKNASFALKPITLNIKDIIWNKGLRLAWYKLIRKNHKSHVTKI